MPSALRMAMITVGSVRGKLWLETTPRVAQGLRGAPSGRLASVGGQMRLVPAWTERVRWPHCAQKGVRVFQSIRARAWP